MSSNLNQSANLRAKFRRALLEEFTDPLLELLTVDYFPLQYSFSRVAPPAPGINFEYRLHQLIDAARMDGWLLDLVAAVHERRPKNKQITEVAEALGLTITGPRLDNPTGSPLEEIVRANAAFITPAILYERLPILEGQVCRVEVPGGGGTGFLVGPDLVLTNDHVINRVRQGQARWQDVRCRFDWKQTLDGSPVALKKETLVGLDAANWLVSRQPPSQYDWDPNLGDALPEEMDYALLRLAEPIGDSPVGGDTADDRAQPRGWIDTHTVPPPLTSGNQIFMLQHPKGEPLRLSIGTVTGFNTSGTRLRYDANSKDGSSGAPCFNADLQLVALHHAHDPAYPPSWNQGIPFTSIQQFWQTNNIVVP